MVKGFLVAGAMAAAMVTVPASASTFINFAKFEDGTSLSNQLPGLSFSLTGGEQAGSPLVSSRWAGSIELNNSVTGQYPTGTFLNIGFATATSGISFLFNNYGGSETGRGASYYTSYNAKGAVVSTGFLGYTNYGSGPVTVAGNGIRSLVISNNAGSGSWEFGIQSLTYTAAAGVPEPATWTMLILGFGAVGYALRRKAKVTTSVRFA